MEIIQRGQKPEEKPYRVTCRTCDTVFEFLRSEAKYVPDQRDGDYVEINCPVCHRPATHFA